MQTPLGKFRTHPRPIVGSSLSVPLYPVASKGNPGNAKCVTEIFRGDKIKKLGTKVKCGQLNLRKIIKIVATKCHILRLKCTKFDFGWGSAPDPAGGAHRAPPYPLAGFKGSYF